MASIIELQSRVKLLESFSKVVNIQKIVVMKKIAELKGRMKTLANSYDLLFATIDSIKQDQSLLFDKKLFVSNEQLEKHVSKEEFKLRNTIIADRRTIYKKAIFLMSTKPIDKISRYSIKRMAHMAAKAYCDDIIYIALGDELIEELKSLNVPIYASIGSDVVFAKTNKIFKTISELSLQMYESLISTNIAFVFDDIENPRELKEITLLPFTEDFGKKNIDFSALAGTKDEDVNKILEGINVKKTTFERGLEVTADFLIRMQIQNIVELAHLSYVFSSSNRELHNLDDKEKNVEAEQEITTLRMQRIRKESITNELISNSGAFMGITTAKEEEDE